MLYAVEVIQTWNRGTRNEQSRALGVYDYYRDAATAAAQAAERDVPVTICNHVGELDE
jgi:hypothetical protein